MVRPPSVDSNGMKKGAWSEEEDNKLRAYVTRYGHWNWRLLPKYAGLARCGKSCRLRWVNYLKPGVKKGNFTKEEEDLIVKLHARLGNKWSAIATKLPGRTDNEIKNFYHTRIDKNRKRKPSSRKVPEASYKYQVFEEEKAFEFRQLPQTAGDANHKRINPSFKKFPEASSYKDQILEGEKAFEFPEATILPNEFTQTKVDIFQIDTNYNPTDSFPLLIEDEFQYPELHYSELSCSDSSYRSTLDWITEDDHSMMSTDSVGSSVLGSLWSECSESNYQNQISPTGFYDPLFQDCFDYEMDLFS